MYCTNCGVEFRETDRFCSQCGRTTGPGRTNASAYAERRLRLPLDGKKLLGVCAGFANYFGVDPTLMRILWLFAALASGGVGFVAYLIAWLLMPKESPAASQTITAFSAPAGS